MDCVKNIKRNERLCNIIMFCTLCILGGIIVLVLYHIKRNQEDIQPIQPEKPTLNHQENHSDFSDLCSSFYMAFLGDGVCDDFANTEGQADC